MQYDIIDFSHMISLYKRSCKASVVSKASSEHQLFYFKIE